MAEPWRHDFTAGDGRARIRARCEATLLLVLAVALGAGCADHDRSPNGETARPTATSDPLATSRINVESLGLSFRLPPSFHGVDDHPDFLFLARNPSPRAIFSIEPDNPTVVEHEARPGETVEPAEIDRVDAVIVTDAHLEDLPSGIAARELLVANGDRSFTLIMSAPEPELPFLWGVFIGSVRIQPE